MSNFNNGISVCDPPADLAITNAARNSLTNVRDQTESIKGAGGAFGIDPAFHAQLASIPQLDLSGLRDAAASAAGVLKGVGSFKDQIKLAGLDAAVERIRDLTGGMKITSGAFAIDPALRSQLASIPQLDLSGLQEAAASVAGALKGVEGLTDQMQLAGLDGGLSKVAQKIADQQSAIASLRPLIPEMPRLSVREPMEFPVLRAHELDIPPNPIHETNERLASIEQRFNRMEKIALDGAEIATGLQASAATFLAKFEKASSDNDRTSARVVWLAFVAIVIAIAMPVAQVFYTELWRAPADSASTQIAIADMKGEIKALQDTQKMASDELAKVLSFGNADMASALRDIRNLLMEQQKRTVVVPPSKR